MNTSRRLVIRSAAVAAFVKASAAGAETSCIPFTAERQRDITPAAALQLLKDGNARFVADKSINCDLMDGRNLTTPSDQLPASDVSLECLAHSSFNGDALGGDPGFGGPETKFSHFGGVNGRLENVPHNVIHDDIGGLMSDPNTAALDPVFWLHHANIDRLWEVWKHRDPIFTDPSVVGWLTDVSFVLHDATGGIANFTPSQMGDTTSVRHGYQYDDVSDPIPKTPAAMAAAAGIRVMATTPHHPELVAASRVLIPLTGTTTSVRVAFHQPARLAATARLAGVRPARAFLNIEQGRQH